MTELLQSSQFALTCAGGLIVILTLVLLVQLNRYEARQQKELKDMDKTKGGK